MVHLDRRACPGSSHLDRIAGSHRAMISNEPKEKRLMKLRRILTTPILVLLACPAFGLQANRGNAEATVNGKQVSISYGRPSLKGRDILSMVPVGGVWRLGANQATEITSAGDLNVNGTSLKAGKYSLWLKKIGDNSWALEFHPKTGVWGMPELKEGYVAELPLKLQTASDSAEQLTITLKPNGGNAGIDIHWGTAELTGSFGVK